MVEHHEHGKTRNKNDILKEVGHVLAGSSSFIYFLPFLSFFLCNKPAKFCFENSNAPTSSIGVYIKYWRLYLGVLVLSGT